MSNGLSKQTNQKNGQQFSSRFQQPETSQLKARKGFFQKILFIILGILLTILVLEVVLLVRVKDKKRSDETEGLKEIGISQEVKPLIATEAIESSWKGKKTILVKGKVSNFDVNNRKIVLVLENNIVRTVSVDDKTIFIKMAEQENSFWEKLVEVEAASFWEDLKIDDEIQCSCYEKSDLAAFVTFYDSKF